MGTKERREREMLETREKILSAARDMFADEGFESVTMREIAKRIEYTPTAIYHHFPSKQALLTELCACDFAKLGEHFRESMSPSDPIQRLKDSGMAYLRFAMEHPSHYRFMFMTILPETEVDPEYVEQNLLNPERNAYLMLRENCAAAIEQKRFRAEITDPDSVAQILWSTIHGLVSLRFAKSHDKFVPWRDLEQTTVAAMDLLFRGLLRETKPC
jgi:AcrR family transcriptional regulator